MTSLVTHNPKVKARRVTLTELRELPTPRALSDRHNPIPHHVLIETLEDRIKEVLDAKVEERELAVGRGKGYWKEKGKPGMADAALFAVLKLSKHGPAGTRYAIGVRQSLDRTMSIQMCAGLNVFVCDNMAFHGDTTFLQEKHLKSLDLAAELDEKLGKEIKEKFQLLNAGVGNLKGEKIDDQYVKAFIFQTQLEKLLPAPKFYEAVYAEWKEPKHEEFKPRTLWSLNNCYTEVMKDLPETIRQDRIQELGRLMGLGSETKN